MLNTLLALVNAHNFYVVSKQKLYQNKSILLETKHSEMVKERNYVYTPTLDSREDFRALKQNGIDEPTSNQS